MTSPRATAPGERIALGVRRIETCVVAEYVLCWSACMTVGDGGVSSLVKACRW